MSTPLWNAIRGKGFATFSRRGQSIIQRYGLTASRMNRALQLLVDTLGPFAYKATLPITAVVLARQTTLVQQYHAQGIEFAVHGLTHMDYTQLSLDEQLAHLERARQIFDQTGIQVKGFRCPYLRWNDDTLTALEACKFEYDSSQALFWKLPPEYETATYQRVLSFYGARAAEFYPSLPRLEGKLVRIPYGVPDDEALVERLALKSPQLMAEIWLDILNRTYLAGEMFTLGLHPERTGLCHQALIATLTRARALSPLVWIARLDEIARWWRNLEQASFVLEQAADGVFKITLHAPADAIVLTRSVEVEGSTQPGSDGYQRLSLSQFSFRANKRPIIGVHPDSSASLSGFLRQQGYLVEISPDAQNYSIYFQQPRFAPEDERPLLAEMEKRAEPLIRLARWPNGARSALCVTGDIDAFTLGDYGLRAMSR